MQKNITKSVVSKFKRNFIFGLEISNESYVKLIL